MALNTNSDELRKLRDQLLEKRALQQKAKVASESATVALQNTVKEFNEKGVDTLIELGIDSSCLKNIDYERLQVDAQYLGKLKDDVATMMESVQFKLEEILNVPN